MGLFLSLHTGTIVLCVSARKILYISCFVLSAEQVLQYIYSSVARKSI